MSILYGLYRPDEGEIRVDGEPVTIDSPRRAIDLGIGMVHQHFMLIPVMTVAENIVLADEPRSAGGLLDVQAADARVRELSDRFGLAVDPDAVIEDVSVGQQQRVEILKALYREARILVLDEPTAVLTAQETQDLFRVLRGAARRRQGDRLHHAQARRGARHRRPRDGAAARQAGRHRADRGRDRGVARPAHGRPRRPPARRQGAARSAASRSSRSATCTCATTATCRPCRAST